MKYTKEQLKAAYALNLCTVSVSQIIDYEDINVMEQEYEAILNNLNLEQMPKDEALLNILKQILDTITYFRIDEVEKEFIEKEYQQRLKNALWSSVPNIGFLIAGGDPLTMAISLASQVGVGYMNYRKNKAEINSEIERKRWELERTAIEQFNGLRRELFDTAWRLSATYNFPDELRLTERQIKQYNSILMDNDLLRKYDRLRTIQDSFAAYPPFWYNLGNTANAIFSSNLPLSVRTKEEYKNKAKENYFKYRELNEYSLLREDPVSAACSLELLELLDFSKDIDQIKELLEEAIKFSGKANDVLQIAAISYLKLNEYGKAGQILEQLVNEQYNTILNAQLLSSVYVKKYIQTKSFEMISRYEILCTRVNKLYLYPMPMNDSISIEEVEKGFVSLQKNVISRKYIFAIKAFIEKYMVKFGKLIPVIEQNKKYTDAYFLGSDFSIQSRKHALAKVFANERKAEDYKDYLLDASIKYSLLELLNEMFNECCHLDLMTNVVQDNLSSYISNSIIKNKDNLNYIDKRIQERTIDYIDMEKLLEMRFMDYTEEFFKELMKEIEGYINSRNEMQDFILAEENLINFCNLTNLPDPIILFENEGNNLVDTFEILKKRFDIDLLGEKKISKEVEISNENKMIELIRKSIPKIVKSNNYVEFFTNEDPRKERYFRKNAKLKSNPRLVSSTLAILDSKNKKGDYDLLFTVYGIVSVKNGVLKVPVAYDQISIVNTKELTLIIDGKFENDSINLIELYKLIKELNTFSKPTIEKTSNFKLLDFRKPFAKK